MLDAGPSELNEYFLISEKKKICVSVFNPQHNLYVVFFCVHFDKQGDEKHKAFENINNLHVFPSSIYWDIELLLGFSNHLKFHTL